MKILINGISSKSGGAIVYLTELIKNITKIDNNLKIYLLIEENLKENFENLLSSDQIITTKKSWIVVRLLKEWILINFLILKFRIQYVIFPGGLILPILFNVKKIIVMQNMLPFDNSQLVKYRFSYQWLRLIFLRHLTIHSLKKCNVIIYISKFSKTILEKKFNIIKKNQVIPLGISKFYLEKDNSKKILKGKYFTYVSFIDFYKSQIELIYGYNVYRRKGGNRPLYIIGDANPQYLTLVKSLIRDLKLSRYIKILPHQTKYKLRNIYQKAHVNIFASQIENCPNILFEIMASKQQSLISSFTPMPDFSEETVLYFNPSSIYDISEKLHIADKLANCGKKELIDKAFVLVQKYSWSSMAKMTLNLLRSL